MQTLFLRKTFAICIQSLLQSILTSFNKRKREIKENSREKNIDNRDIDNKDIDNKDIDDRDINNKNIDNKSINNR